MGSPLSMAMIILKLRSNYKLKPPSLSSFNLPVQVHEKDDHVEPEPDHRVPQVPLHHAPVVDLGRIVNAQIPSRHLYQIIQQPTHHRCIRDEQNPASVEQQHERQEAVGGQLRNDPKVQLRAALLGVQIVTLQVGQDNHLKIR